MAIQLARPRDVSVRIVDPARAAGFGGHRRRRSASGLGVAARGILSGMAIGLALLAEPGSGASVATVGAIAIGAALLSWDP